MMAGAKSLVVLCILLIIATSQAAPCKFSICYRLCRSAGGSKTFCAKKCHCSGLLSTFFSNELEMEDYNCAGAVHEEMMMMMEDDYNHAEAVLEEMSVEELISFNDKLTTMSKCKYNPCYRACRALGGSKDFCAKKCHCSLPAFFPNELATNEEIQEEEMMMMREEHGLDDKLTAPSAAASVASISNQHALTKTYPVDFKLMLNVDELTATSYQNFITDLRSNLAKGAHYSGKVPILPSYGKNPPHLFDVLLKHDNREVTVRVRHDNLYVRGYLMITPNQWMEFKDVDGLHMVDPNSEFLDFGDRYNQMESAAHVKVTDILYTKVSLSDVVLKLSKSTEKKEQARSLIFMAQMISEAARFPDVSSFFGNHLAKGEHLPIWMRTMQNDWGKFSKVVQCYDKYKKKYKYKEVTINGVVYKTVDQLREIFGVMLKEPHLDEKTCGIKKLADKDEL